MPSHKPGRTLKLLPDIASKIKPRAGELVISASTYVGILISNQAIGGLRLEAQPDSPRFVRVPFYVSLRTPVRKALRKIAKSEGLSENAAVEALLAQDQQEPRTPLTILIHPAKK